MSSDGNGGVAHRLTQRLLEALGAVTAFIPFHLLRPGTAAAAAAERVGTETVLPAEPPASEPALFSGVPSLFDAASEDGRFSGRREDALMEAVEAWPLSRMNVLQQVRESLGRRVAVLKRRSEAVSVTDLFDHMETIGRGSYGSVSIGCLRSSGNSRGCEKFILDVPGVGLHSLPVYMAVKTVRIPAEVAKAHARGAAVHFSVTREGIWLGNVNVMREVLVGRFLNHLVSSGVTPHLPVVYDVFDAAPAGTIAIVMELCHLNFDNFLYKVLPRISDATLRIQLLRVALLQLAHGLAAAQYRFDVRHNDLHAGNAMMTFITNTTYTYEVDGVSYSVPNHGMCWKLTDFGFASSSKLFETRDTIKALVHGRVAHRVRVSKLLHHAVEVVDFLRLLQTARASAVETRFAPQVRFCDAIEAAVHDLAVREPDASGSLRAFSSETTTDPAVLMEMARHHGLMTSVFILLANEPVGSKTTASGPVYNMDAKLFQEGLTGIEGRFYVLHSSGRLLKRSDLI